MTKRPADQTEDGLPDDVYRDAFFRSPVLSAISRRRAAIQPE